MRLEIRNLKKEYAPAIGLLDANLHADGGDVLALVGPNGSGKSTMVRILVDASGSDFGECLLDGIPVSECKRRIGYLPEVPYLVETMTGRQFLRYIAAMKGTVDDLDETFAEMTLLGAHAYADRRLSTLSQGQRKQFAFLASLIGEPDMLELDEPTNGLDSLSLIRMKDIIRARSESKKITVLTSHMLDFVRTLATKAVFIKRGVTCPEDPDLDNMEEKYVELFAN